MKKKWMAWALIGLIGITSVPAPEYAEAAGEEKIKAAEMPLKQPDKKQRKKWKQKEETVYRKVQDLEETQSRRIFSRMGLQGKPLGWIDIIVKI